MKYYVFIARDEEEFSRYPQSGFQELKRDFAKTIRYKEMGGSYLLIISSDVKPKNAESDEDVKIMCFKVAAAIKSVNTNYDYAADKDCVHIFVHVGGEGSCGLGKMEESLKKKVGEIKKNWKVFLLNSSWRWRIDVKQSMIRLPNREGGLDILVKRCEMDIAAEILKGFKARYNSENSYNEICKNLSIVKIEEKRK